MVTRAYRDEIAGAAFARNYPRRGLDAAQREALDLIERLEVAISEVLAPHLPAPLSEAEVADAERDGVAATHRLGSWAAILLHSAQGLDQYIERYAQLMEGTEAHERGAIEILLAHEKAVKTFGETSLAGYPDGAAPAASPCSSRDIFGCAGLTPWCLSPSESPA